MAEEEWERVIEEASLSPTTKKNYIYNIGNVLGAMGSTILYVLKHPDETVAELRKRYRPPSVRTQATAVVGLFKHWEKVRHAYPAERETWCALMKEMDKNVQTRMQEGDPTEREMVNWVPWPKVLLAEKKMRTTEPASDRHLLLAMYTHMEPVRADYGNVRMYVEQGPSDDQEEDRGNYMVLSTENSYLVLDEYKTRAKLGTFKREVPPSLVSIIVQNMTNKPRSHLFVQKNGEPYTKKNSFVQYANRQMYSIFGKHFTISLFRHSFISSLDFNESKPNQIIGHAKNMMHSVHQQQMYRRFVPETTVTLEDDEEEKKKQTKKKKEKKKKKKKKKRRSDSDSQDHQPRVLLV
jgi:hypothetical protein